MDEEGRLRNVTQKAQAIVRARRPRLLGEAVNRYIAERIEPQQEASDSVTAAWREVIPQNLSRFCRVAEIVHGRVRIVVSSPSYLHQLRLSGPRLLSQLQARCGRKAVKEIKFEIGR
jgi:hypothetical protein